MSNTNLKVIYDGESLVNHAMDVKDLAPALLSLGDLFDNANYIFNGESVKIKIEVKALESGSFGINFNLLQSKLSQFSSFLTGDSIASILNLKEIIFGGTVVGIYTVKGLFALIRILSDRKPDKVKDLNNGYVELTVSNEIFIIPSRLLVLYKEESIRKCVEETLKPLAKNGIDTFSVYSNENLLETVKKAELSLFKTPEIQDEVILNYEHEAAYSIISLAFKEDNKWRLHDGSATISVRVIDERFLKKVELNQVSFTKGDILICKVKTVQFKTATGLRTEYDLLEVIDHQKAGRQLDIFDIENSNDV